MDLIQNIEQFLENKIDFYIDLLQQMVDINSFTKNSEGVNQLGELTAKIFSPLGFDAEFVQAANPDYGKHLFLKSNHHPLPGKWSAPTLAMISHLDTVFAREEELQNDFFWRPDGNRIYGPGTVDIKGGTVMIYMVLDAIRTLKPSLFEQVSWLVCIDACEEALSEDFSRHCIDRLPEETLACLVFEGGSVEEGRVKLVTSRKGRATFRVQVTGKSAHAGNSHQNGANAIVQMAHTIQKIAALSDYGRDLTFNVGVIRGGSVVNRVPHYSEAEVEMRAFSSHVFNAGVTSMLALDGTSDLSSYDGGFPCSVSIELLDQMEPWPNNRETLSLFQLWRETGKLIGAKIEEQARGGLIDGNLLSTHYPTIDGLGPVGANAHCSERTADGSKVQEYVTISSFVPRALLNTLSILKIIEESAATDMGQ